MKNFGYCKYTYIHRKVLFALAEKLIKDNEVKKIVLENLRIHDMDKMTLYLLWPKDVSSNYHRLHAAHHMNNDIEKDFYTLIETCLDYASARYSKPDKPLPCKETIDNYYPEFKEQLYPIMDYLGINVDNLEMDEDIRKYVLTLEKTITEEDIYVEVMDYLTSYENNVFKEIY